MYKIKKVKKLLLTSVTTVILVSHSAQTDETTLAPGYAFSYFRCTLISLPGEEEGERNRNGRGSDFRGCLRSRR